MTALIFTDIGDPAPRSVEVNVAILSPSDLSTIPMLFSFVKVQLPPLMPSAAE